MKRIFALVDCNNFYASCERVFNPSLKTRPVIVLSNNDGCVVALSAEAKKIGIPFASPYFKIKPLVDKYKIAVFSSNYTLYADMSNRVMTILSSFSPEVEVYSVDEAFLSFTGMKCNLPDYGREIRETVMKWTGLPVSVGIAHTKTLAKGAAHLAKKDISCGGVLDLTMNDRSEYLKKINVGSIWGVGAKYAEKLNSRGIYTAADFVTADDKWVRSHMTITGLRTLMELRGHSCMTLDEAPSPKKAIVSSRSFGQSVESLESLRQSVSSYAARAAEKLRGENGLAGVVTVFIMTNRFKDDPQYGASLSCELPEASANTPVITRYALELLNRLYKDGYSYKKAGVMLSGIVSTRDLQMNLFLGEKDRGSTSLMETVDKVNRSHGSGTLFYASAGTDRPWSMRREFLSPAYTTRWEEIVEIKI